MASVDIGGQYKRIVRLFWDPEPENDDAQEPQIWCLGELYMSNNLTQSHSGAQVLPLNHSISREDDTERDAVLVSRPSAMSRVTAGANENDCRDPITNQTGASSKGWPEAFVQDFESRFWFTYRSSFPVIKKSDNPKSNASLSLAVRLRNQLGDQNGFSADTGWGCMIRSGQCVLANALAIMILGRGWRRGKTPDEEKRIISLFADDPRAPYSIHQFVKHGEAACGKYPGEWFGPSATAQCIDALTAAHEPTQIKVYVTGDGAEVHEDRVMELASAGEKEFTPVILLIGTRLGIDKVNPIYWNALQQIFQLPQSLGIAGGQPSASHYFVGVQGEHFFYLDPHQTRPALPFKENPADYNAHEVDSCHTRRLRRLHMDDMDPSMLMAFLINSKADWTKWKLSVQNIQGKAVLHIVDEEPVQGSRSAERAEAIDEVETFDEE